jgi:hypothetical protein
MSRSKRWFSWKRYYHGPSVTFLCEIQSQVGCALTDPNMNDPIDSNTSNNASHCAQCKFDKSRLWDNDAQCTYIYSSEKYYVGESRSINFYQWLKYMCYNWFQYTQQWLSHIIITYHFKRQCSSKILLFLLLMIICMATNEVGIHFSHCQDKLKDSSDTKHHYIRVTILPITIPHDVVG